MSDRPHDKKATALLMKYHRFVFWHARCLIPFPDLAEDVAQQVFVEFLSHTDRWNLEDDVRPILKTLVHRCAVAVWRDRAKTLPDALSQITEFVQQEQNDNSIFRDDQMAALRNCSQKLPQGARQLIARHYFDGISVKQIAKEIHQKAATVGKSIYRIREKLRHCIELTIKAEEHNG